jgi:hypothetical protein
MFCNLISVTAWVITLVFSPIDSRSTTLGLRGRIFRCRFKEHWVLNVRPIVKLAAAICLVLTLWSVVTVVAHHHPKGTESATCSVCIAAHSAAPKAGVTVASATFTSISIFRADAVSAKERFIAFALSVRPPPTIA